MPYILNIHTATEEAIVNICDGEKILATLYNNDPKHHATFLHTAIKEILEGVKIAPKHLNAVGVTRGPGSYTGIRVGLAAAKGLCFALNIPLITINTLEVMAHSLKSEIQDADALYCPMIDARRMEVFTAIYDFNLREVFAPRAVILDSSIFSSIAQGKKLIFSGNGCIKLRDNNELLNTEFHPKITITSKSLASCGEFKFSNANFDDIAYSSAEYLKEFYLFPK